MPSRLNASDIHLDHIHSEAVCQGIGEKLRDTMGREQPEMPENLQTLIARLTELDREHAPSLVPELEVPSTH